MEEHKSTSTYLHLHLHGDGEWEWELVMAATSLPLSSALRAQCSSLRLNIPDRVRCRPHQRQGA